MTSSFVKKDSVFVNNDKSGYINHKRLKQRMINQQKEILELNERLKRVEELVLNQR